MVYTLNKKKIKKMLKKKYNKTFRLKNKNSITKHKGRRKESKNYYGGVGEELTAVETPFVRSDEELEEGRETSQLSNIVVPVETEPVEQLESSVIQEPQSLSEEENVLPSSLEETVPEDLNVRTASSLLGEGQESALLDPETSGTVVEQQMSEEQLPSSYNVDVSETESVPVEIRSNTPSEVASFEEPTEDVMSSQGVVDPLLSSGNDNDDPLEQIVELPTVRKESTESIFPKQEEEQPTTSENNKFITIRIALPSGTVDLQGNASNSFEQTIGSILGTHKENNPTHSISELNDRIDKLYELVNQLSSKISEQDRV